MSGHHRVLAAEVAGVAIPEEAIFRHAADSGRVIYRWADVLAGTGILGY